MRIYKSFFRFEKCRKACKYRLYRLMRTYKEIVKNYILIYKETYGRAAFAGYLIKATIREGFSADYIYLYTNSSLYDSWKSGVFIQSTIQNIGADRYADLPIVIPNSFDEQLEIVDYLNNISMEIDKIISRKEEIFAELESYKKSLIYEYVTGKKEAPQT